MIKKLLKICRVTPAENTLVAKEKSKVILNYINIIQYNFTFSNKLH